MFTRQPNTEYILSLSYGKDSLACLEAIKQLGYPLDRIVHAEVWATDTISADLPPMVEFKKHADKIILDRYGIEVEHICAMTGGREREREREQLSSEYSTGDYIQKNINENKYMGFQWSREPGVIQGLKRQPSIQKITYEKIFYHTPKRKPTSQRKGIYGFPISAIRGNWCTGLKTQVFIIAPHRVQI